MLMFGDDFQNNSILKIEYYDSVMYQEEYLGSSWGNMCNFNKKCREVVVVEMEEYLGVVFGVRIMRI